MKTKIGVGLAALSALAAEGKDFNREELNAMLDKLAASPEPKVRRGPTAMCYEMAMPERKSFDYLCRKCGMRTHYPENYEGLGEELAFYRDGAAKLRGMGLGIALDESALCRHCTTLKALDIPTSGVIVSEPKRTLDNKWWLKRFGLRIGDSVTVKEWGRRQCSVLPRNIEYWIPEKYIDKELSLRELIETPNDGYLYSVDIDNNINYHNIKLIQPSALPEEYLPGADSYYAFEPVPTLDANELMTYELTIPYKERHSLEEFLLKVGFPVSALIKVVSRAAVF